MRCCFNPKFLIVATALVAGTWLLFPQAALPVAAVLIGLSCPVSMFLAARRSQGGSCTTPNDADDSSEHEPKLDERIRTLRNEIERLREHREKT
ncbi:hypothetical protein [Actinopolyspora halophila]|uniref:hypothetical protein n=1 Tax=Actinopolyspora halophila TaxID=1850 RepID=UPI0012F88662|nr:hypothetical protein [Actinopolyspora halophila]